MYVLYLKQLILVFSLNLNVYHQYAGIYKIFPGFSIISKHFILSKSALYFACGFQGFIADLNSKFS